MESTETNGLEQEGRFAQAYVGADDECGVVVGRTWVVQGLRSRQQAERVAYHLNEIIVMAKQEVAALQNSPAELRRAKSVMIWLAGIVSYAVCTWGILLSGELSSGLNEDGAHPLRIILNWLNFGIFILGFALPIVFHNNASEQKGSLTLIGVRRHVFHHCLIAAAMVFGAQAVLYLMIHVLAFMGA